MFNIIQKLIRGRPEYLALLLTATLTFQAVLLTVLTLAVYRYVFVLVGFSFATYSLYVVLITLILLIQYLLTIFLWKTLTSLLGFRNGDDIR